MPNKKITVLLYRQTPEKEYGQMVGVAQKTKVKYLKKPKLFGGLRENT